MSPSTFRQTVAEVAARAKERLPEAVNGRIAHAVKLVLAHDVTPQADGTILVGSSSDPMKTYRLEGTTCPCHDFVHGKGTEGWCQHRIAAGIHKRVQELLPQEPVDPELLEPYPDNNDELPAPEPVEAPEPTPSTPLPEAAFSITLKGTLDGVEALLTARGATAAEFTRNLQAIRGLLDPGTPRASTRPMPPVHEAPVCPYHGAMKASTKAPGTWYCAAKMGDGSYCKERSHA